MTARPEAEPGRDGAAAGRSDEPLVSIRGLKTYYTDSSILSSQPPVQAVDGVDLDVYEGETVGLVGESGCGKTTLGRTLLGLEDATAGTVEASGRDVTDLSRAERREWQENAGMVFQDPEESLNDRMTVGEIVREPLDAHDWPTLTVAVEGDARDRSVEGDAVPAGADGTPDLTVGVDADGSADVAVRDRLPLDADEVDVTVDADAVRVDLLVDERAVREGRVTDLLERVGLNEEHFYRYPHQFSGGQRQRVGIARALALEPDFLVLDEPTSALDVSVQARIINLLDDLQAELGLTYLFITHDLSVVRHIADRVAVMYLGSIVESGPTREVYADPGHPYTVSLLSAIPGSGSPWDGERVTLRGAPPSPRDPPSGCPFATRCPAKIRPDDWSFPEATWRALDALRVLFRTRARAETPTATRAKQLLGMSVDDESLTDAARDVLDAADLPPDARAVVDDAVDDASHGDDRAAAARMREAFGSRCDEEFPAPETGGRGRARTNRCLRREAEYDGARETVERRQHETDGTGG
ncbi:ABC transporter ATP-binding protein [Candidatus Halobonum tyrrellensis]|uniref:Oligopeptide/dipeptide ABC transporter ATPase n=1 Tax=Candidatus Halobonum tyrrellensis G22 TaxID=1324957 RepID=V4HBM7_9EURY|nr:ABC transporter ATP-binding protein [Candidatus Halobonum tyrrellensis]ESP88115.1 oligopeptide/dipeptide ABC transporter ATPase [Candidatus Halobonum tyrrellensis G22]